MEGYGTDVYLYLKVSQLKIRVYYRSDVDLSIVKFMNYG